MVNYLPIKWALTVTLLLGLNLYLNAQLSTDLPLQSNDPQVQALISPEVPVVTMQQIDLNPYIEEDLINDAQDNGGWRFAVSVPVNLASSYQVYGSCLYEFVVQRVFPAKTGYTPYL